MNNKLREILSEYLNVDETLSVCGLSKATTNLQQSDRETIVFYRLRNDEKSIRIFENRLEKSEFGLLILTGEKLDRKLEQTIFIEESEVSKVQEKVCDALYPLSKKIKLVAVTGTNGKTSTVHFAREICRVNGILAASLGTEGLFLLDQKFADFGHTTPSYIDFRRILFSLEEEHCQVLFFELSSHALEQNRIGHMTLDAAGWTNFTQDHLDFHVTMENYFNSKKKILFLLSDSSGLFVSERELLSKIDSKKVRMAEFVENVELPSFLTMGFVKKNFILAWSLVKEVYSSVSFENIDEIKSPEGRAQFFEFKERVFVIDYAHTPDGLKNILYNLKSSFSTKKIISVFGCGGDRDRSKRAKMAETSEEYSDFSIVTTDNPRFEDPVLIIEDIKKGFRNQNYEVVVDRKDAIKRAVSLSSNDNIVLIAGKGAEDYLDMLGKKYPYKDEDELKKAIIKYGQ